MSRLSSVFACLSVTLDRAPDRSKAMVLGFVLFFVLLWVERSGRLISPKSYGRMRAKCTDDPIKTEKSLLDRGAISFCGVVFLLWFKSGAVQPSMWI